jgi:hypothetical protein
MLSIGLTPGDVAHLSFYGEYLRQIADSSIDIVGLVQQWHETRIMPPKFEGLMMFEFSFE